MAEVLGKHAVVLGASMAGLLAAKVLADRFERVTVVERDRLGDDAAPRKGVPQGRHVHGIYSTGVAVLEELFPGIVGELLEAGSSTGDLGTGVRWWHWGGWRVNAAVGRSALAQSR